MCCFYDVFEPFNQRAPGKHELSCELLFEASTFILQSLDKNANPLLFFFGVVGVIQSRCSCTNEDLVLLLWIPPPSLETVRNELLELNFIIRIAFQQRFFFMRDRRTLLVKLTNSLQGLGANLLSQGCLIFCFQRLDFFVFLPSVFEGHLLL